MKNADWPGMSDVQLVDAFAAVTREQDEAILAAANAKYNRLYSQMVEIVDELKRRPGDGRRGLVGLYDSPNIHVRLKAAIHTLAVAPAAARKQLELISEMNWFPQTADALGMLRAIDRGEYTPT